MHITIEDITTDIYSITPSETFPRIPAPTPEITKAIDGLFVTAQSFSHSSLDIFLSEYNSVAAFIPNGNPQTDPIMTDPRLACDIPSTPHSPRDIMPLPGT
jgi:hypothetical protein